MNFDEFEYSGVYFWTVRVLVIEFPFFVYKKAKDKCIGVVIV